MKVLYFTRDYSPHDHRFLSALAQTPHQVFSLRLERRGMQREDRPLPPEIHQVLWAGGKEPVSRLDGLRLLPALKQVLRQVQPDVVHAGTVQTAALMTAMAGFHPLVTMSWGSDLLKDADRDAFCRWATRYTLQRTDVLVGDCRAVAEKAAGFGFPRERVVLFPWGVDLDIFKPGPSDPLVRPPGWQDCFVLLSLRSWEPLYGVDVVVKAFSVAAQQEPSLRLLLLGTGSQSAAIKKMLLDHQLLDRVILPGQVTNQDLTRYYRSADLYLSASYSDGSSVSLMEALACGLPALVSAIPGNREWIEPGRVGWLFETGNSQDLAEKILAAVQQRQNLNRLSQQARELAEQRANWTENFKRLLYAYDLAAGQA